MRFDEQGYIALCRQKIEERFAFGNGHGYTQRDLESLSEQILEKTQTSISISTLKRVWKGDFKQVPQIATLDALAAVIDYKDWQEFKMQNQAIFKVAKPSFPKYLWWILTSLFAISVTMFIFFNFQKKVRVNGPVHFSSKKTVTSGIPNTVIFKYDVSNVEADSFFLQQSWNELHRVAIDPKGNTHTSIYYEPGYHRAKLYANDSLIAKQPVHILSDGWQPHIYYNEKDLEPIHFRGEQFIRDGFLHLDETLLQKRAIYPSQSFTTRISNSQDFKLSSDNFSLQSRMKVDSINGKLCPWMQMTIVAEKHIFYVRLYNKGCENYASYKVGEIIRNGESNDLSALGINPYDWQDVGIHVQGKHTKITLNGITIYEEDFKEDFGQIMALLYIFDGTGSLDEIQLTDVQGKKIFSEDFGD